MRISKSMIKSGLAAFVLLLSVMPEAGARTCFLPDSEDCGEGDVGISDIEHCRYYSREEAKKSSEYKNDKQDCYVSYELNKGGTKVQCWAVRCKMSQTECEEKAEGTNKCCNRDVASGCYYVGTCPKECDRSVYSYDSEQTGDGWTCISCHDNKGTFYKCNYDKTCEEQGYATSCSDEQIAEEVTGAKGQNGEKCYICKGKPVENKTCAEYGLIAEADCDKNKNTFTTTRTDDYGNKCGICVQKSAEPTCDYVYYHATPSNTCGTTGNLDAKDSTGKYSCTRINGGTCCYSNLSLVESIKIGDGTPGVMPIYNRISNTSASCKRNNKTYYEKICAGTPKEKCTKKFTPNGCVSEAYNEGFEVKGTEWGTCGCDMSAGKYDSAGECQNNNTGKGCTLSGGCYQTCEALGYYSTEAACKSGMSSVYECVKADSCFIRQSKGFMIRYADAQGSKYKCQRGSSIVTHTPYAYLSRVSDNGYAEDVNGETHDIRKSASYYPAGTYFVCAGYTGGDVATLVYTNVQGLGCFSNSDHYKENNCGLETVINTPGRGYAGCYKMTFKNGTNYFISFMMTGRKSTTTESGYTCTWIN